jgi:hypothetical protein
MEGPSTTPPAALAGLPPPERSPGFAQAGGEKAKARDILAAVRTLKTVEQEQRPASEEERQVLARFGGFGAVALSIFPDPLTGRYKDAGWQALGEELKALLTPEEYASAKRTTFNAFYTSPTVVAAMHEALSRLGVPPGATVLEPGCATGNFMRLAPPGMRFIGVELDRVSGCIARLLHPGHDIRIEDFQDTRLPEGSIHAAIGNPPFADLKLDYRGRKLSLHDYFFAKSIDALKPHGIHAPAAAPPHRRRQLLPGRGPHHPPGGRRPGRAGHLRRHGADRLRHDGRQAPGATHRPARPGTPRPAIAERGLARGRPQRRPPGTQLGL